MNWQNKRVSEWERLKSCWNTPVFQVYHGILEVTGTIDSMVRDGKAPQELGDFVTERLPIISTMVTLEGMFKEKGWTQKEVTAAKMVAGGELLLPKDTPTE